MKYHPGTVIVLLRVVFPNLKTGQGSREGGKVGEREGRRKGKINKYIRWGWGKNKEERKEIREKKVCLGNF